MARRFGWVWAALVLAIGAGYQCLVHSAVAGEQIESIRITLALAPLLALAGWVVMRARNKPGWWLLLLAAGVAIYVLEQHEGWGLAAAYGLPHAAVYSFLLWLFARTLRHGKEPLITRLARRVHGTLPPQLEAYTRSVTHAWCIFFALQLVMSALLFGFASLNAWSLFINILNFPLLALMFIGEYVYRRIRHRDFPHASLWDGIRAYSNDAAPSPGVKCAGTRA